MRCPDLFDALEHMDPLPSSHRGETIARFGRQRLMEEIAPEAVHASIPDAAEMGVAYGQ